MSVSRPTPGSGWRRGFLGHYALHMMREHPIYAFQLATRIGERTGGAWRPSAGAVYPALRSLVERRLARAHVEGRKTLYEITPAGQRWLSELRRHPSNWRARFNSWRLALDFLPEDQVATLVLERLRADFRVLHELVSGDDPILPVQDLPYLREQAASELERALAALRAGGRT